jgi:flagellar biosynthesis/type III secretory pathway protein FliH
MLPVGLRSLMALVEDTLDGEVDETKYPDELSQRILRKIEKSKLTAEENATVKEEATWEQAKREAATEAKALGLREGREAGEREGEARGKAEGLRAAVLDLCEVLGLELTEARKAHLAGLDVAGLEALRQHLKQHRAWPA